jgi:hypothetical protein
MKRFLGIWGSGYGGEEVPETEGMAEDEIHARYYDENASKILALGVSDSIALMDNGFHVVVRLEDS